MRQFAKEVSTASSDSKDELTLSVQTSPSKPETNDDNVMTSNSNKNNIMAAMPKVRHYSITHSLIYSIIHSLIHALTHSLIHLRTRQLQHRPAWAMTEEDSKVQSEAKELLDENELLDFAKNLDYDRYIGTRPVSHSLTL